ncbi:KPN_02809 family neutral zinc metallopeptidase [Aquihabitans sp. McL0605]|uniref:KPN_02809 family neutral zinc metallopeptidase n=1 Tax=Aquihabitans sp. McL0605 TaxID=3415671 RepID=UPI003CEA7012
MKLDDVDGDDFQMEDRRGQASGGGGLGGLGSILGGRGKGAKIGIPALIVVVIGLFISQATGGGGGSGTGGLDDVLNQLGGQTPTEHTAPANTNGSKDAQYVFVGKVGTLLNEYWASYFKSAGESFNPPKAAVFDAPTDTGGCGVGQPEAGPFYCPPSQEIFIDFGFYEQLEKQLGFKGDFAMAYVMAHEYGHHIQNLLGIDADVRKAQQGASQAEVNALSVKLELQADCFAGVWGKSAYQDKLLDDGDFDEAIDAAQAVGDDAIQGSNANQESFTHGTSAQRKQWFTTGFQSGDASSCDTFS